MPVRFSSPTSRPSSLGDGYTFYKKSLIPVVPLVDEVVVDQSDTNEPEPVVVEEPKESKENGEDVKEVDGKRKAAPSEEEGASSENSEKKPRIEESIDQVDGESSDPVKDSEDGSGRETATVPGTSDADESKVGDAGVGVHVKPEPSDTQQETKETSSTSSV